MPHRPHVPGCTASIYQVSTPYTTASTISIIMDSRRLKSSPSTGDWLKVCHWMPTPATSYSAKYLEPSPKAVVDMRDCGDMEGKQGDVSRNHRSALEEQAGQIATQCYPSPALWRWSLPWEAPNFLEIPPKPHGELVHTGRGLPRAW